MLLEVAFTTSLLMFLLLERISNAVGTLLLLLASPGSVRVSSVKRYAGTQVLGAGFSFLASVSSGVAGAVVSTLSGLLSYAVWALVVSLVMSGLYVLNEVRPDVLVVAVEYWNSVLAPVLHALVIVPLGLLEVAIGAVIPLWNAVWFVVTRMQSELLVKAALRNVDPYMQLGAGAFGTVKASAISVAHFAAGSTLCKREAELVCLDPGRRSLDLITPMSQLRQVANALVEILSSLCRAVAAPLDIALYPFRDINFAKGVHGVVNGVMYPVFVMPIVTAERCSMSKSDYLMCMPDFEPAFNMVTVGLRSLGLFVDNWLDVASIIVQSSLGFDPVLGCDSVPLAITPLNKSEEVFGANRTAVVGLTEGLYAVTDGWNVQYFNHYDSVRSVIMPDAWPFQVDPSFGLAAVKYFDGDVARDDAGEATTTIMGCRCDDGDDGQMRIRCALALYESTELEVARDLDRTFDVEFQQRSTAKQLTCREAEISVQSIRWPVRRFTEPLQQEHTMADTCVGRGTCTVVDAAVWVQPRCSSSSSVAQQPICREGNNLASCFPFCMAARRSGSGAANLVLYSTSEWRNKVHLYDRDCAYGYLDDPATSAVNGLASYVGEGLNSPSGGSTGAAVSTLNDVLRGVIKIAHWDPAAGGCTQSRQAVSLVGAEALTGYKGGRFPSLPLPGQPFSFAGDTTLTTVRKPDGGYVIRVDRLYGNMANEFTLVNVLKEFPTKPPAATVLIGSQDTQGTDELPVPYAFNDEIGIKHPSVSTQSAVYFVVNPSTAMFQAFQRWCTDGIGQLQLQALSSYGRIRLWRMEPYVFCPSGDDGRDGCGPGLVRFVDLPGSLLDGNGNVNDANRCNQTFTPKVTNLEYLNADNIAVTYLSVQLKDYNISGAEPYAGKGRYNVVYYNPERNSLQDVPWQKDSGVSSTAEGRLCPAMRRLPQLGSLATETVAMFVNVGRFVVRMVLGLPAIIALWAQGRRCPELTMGHSLAESCGTEVLSMDEAFDSLDRASSHLWGILHVIASRIRDIQVGGKLADSVAAIVDGAGMVAESTMVPIPGASLLVSSAQLPVMELGQAVLSVQGGAVMAMRTVTRAPLAMSRYTYGLISGCVFRLLQTATMEASNGVTPGVVAKRVAAVIGNNVADSQPEFRRLVIASLRRTCAGLGLMMGYTSPGATFMRKSCEALPDAVDGAVSALLSMTFTVPFVHCMCVQSRGDAVNFEHRVMQECHYYAPDYLKGFVLVMVQEFRNTGKQEAVCKAMVDLARAEFEGSMQPLFGTLYDAADALGPSLDYFLRFLDPRGGACTDVETNPYATVLLPEPMDFWGACSITDTCRGKCYASIVAFEQEKQRALDRPYTVKTITQVVESQMFVDPDKDSFMPFKVVAMVELQDCSAVCGGLEAAGAVVDEVVADFNRDACVAVAGVTDGLELRVQKYCLPRALGQGVREAPTEGWTVRGSRDWVQTVLQVSFADVSTGDTLIVLRDNTGWGVEGAPGRDLITVHPRSIQADAAAYDWMYGTQAKVDKYLAIATLERVDDVLPGDDAAAAMVSMYVLPSELGRVPWVFLRVETTGGTTEDLCWPVDVDELLLLGVAQPPQLCLVSSVMTAIVDEGRPVVALRGTSSGSPKLVVLPGEQQAGSPTGNGACVIELKLQGLNGYQTMHQGEPVCYAAGKGFATQTGIPIPWRGKSSTVLTAQSDAKAKAAVSASGVAQRYERVSAQNCLQSYSPGREASAQLLVFTSADPRSTTSWLSQARMALNADSKTATGDSMKSMPAQITVQMMQSCDLHSCVGCPTGALQNLCYEAHRCTIERCVGTVVNQRRPLCNVGGIMKTHAESGVAAMQGVWMVLTETYGTIMGLALLKEEQKELRLAALDDAFYGQVCTLKDLAGASTAMITSIAGAAAFSAPVQNLANAGLRMQGAGATTDRLNAETLMALNGLNSFLFQFALAPMFMMVAAQKTFMCGGNSMLAVVDSDSFSVRIGRKDLQDAASRAVGSCLASGPTQCVNDNAESGAERCVTTEAQNILTKAMRAGTNLASTVMIEPVVHGLDALFSYLLGVVSGMQDFLQVVDAEHCSAPNYYLDQAVLCACGDDAVQIPVVNRTQGLLQHAHWCTGTLRMVNSFGREVYVHNPYTYDELTTHPTMGTTDQYLRCLSGKDKVAAGCDSLRPKIADIDNQGVTPLAVVQRCRDNYNLRQWDAGAWLMYDHLASQGVPLPALVDTSTPPPPVGRCLLRAHGLGEGVLGCMQDWLGVESKKAFRYETITRSLQSQSSLNVAACRIFSGPARSPDAAVAEKFSGCAATNNGTQCEMSKIAWSGGSQNLLPVANEHVVDARSLDERAARAAQVYAEVRAGVVPLLQSLRDFADDNLNVLLFSADGDALHQGFDCFVLGPYARVDLWPSGGGKLPVPTWARDASGVGQTRRLDTPCTLDKLDGDMLPPFTCGSATRRAMIKSFVRNYINDRDRGDLAVEQLVRRKIEALLSVWNDTAKYGCDCPDTGENSPLCCKSGDRRVGTQDNFLPSGLASVEFDTISSSDVAAAVLEAIPKFWEWAHTDPSNKAFYAHHSKTLARTTQGWQWEKDPASRKLAEELGLLWTWREIMAWGATGEDEVGAPFRNGTTLWDACTGLVSQSMFNLPLAKVDVSDGGQQWTLTGAQDLLRQKVEFDPLRYAPEDAGNSTQSVLQRYVAKMLASAYYQTPLFWHHALRHVPSESLMCDGNEGLQRPPGSSFIQFANKQQIPVQALDGLPPIPMQGYAAHALGGAKTGCLCGWAKTAGSSGAMCVVPRDVCAGTLLNETLGAACQYDPAEQTGLVEQALMDAGVWEPGWSCPDMELSDAWGAVPHAALYHWIGGDPTNFTADAARLLVEERAGVRVGNLRTLRDDAAEWVNPSRRREALVSADNKGQVSLRCVQQVLRGVDATNLAAKMVDDLFPMSRAVQESHVVSACLRFAIEYAQLGVLQAMEVVRDTNAEQGYQAAIVTTWKSRCEAQLEMMGMCRAHGVYQMIPEVEREQPCPFVVADDYYDAGQQYYVTPGCLVYKKATDAFYDPCDLQEGLCGGDVPGTVHLQDLQQKIPFDPRQASDGRPIGYWPVTFDTGRAGAEDSDLTQLADEIRAFDTSTKIPRGLSKGFVAGVVQAGGPNAKGICNAPRNKTWGEAEGANDAGMRFCDAVADWWPEDWTKPTGYHVSLPCHHSEAGYRTFDTAFVVDDGEADTIGLIKMVYQHSTLRGQREKGSEYGAAGFCRKGVYGMPRDIVNTMRVCTRDSEGAVYDASVPVRPRYGPQRQLNATYQAELRCADTPYEVPWFAEGHGEAEERSAGSVPLWDGAYAGAQYYPSTSDRIASLRAGVVDGSQQSGCHVGTQLGCTVDADCVGTGAEQGIGLECVRGVCVLNRVATSTCYSHADCAGAGKLCTGDGYCEDPLYQVENMLDESIEFQSYASKCEGKPGGPGSGQEPPEAYDMYGASPWERVPDVLQMHGMCGYRQWYEYQQFVSTSKMGAYDSNYGALCQNATSGACRSVDYQADEAYWWDTSQPDESAGFPTLWQSGKFRVLPHACDRDYMHVQGARGCAPVVTGNTLVKTGFVMLNATLVAPKAISMRDPRGRIMQTYNQGRYVPIIRTAKPTVGWQDSEWAQGGFLFQKTLGGESGGPATPFVPCSSVKQCQQDDFKVAGEPVQRMTRLADGKTPAQWNQSWARECGMFGVKDDVRGCRLDLVALPLYQALCRAQVKGCSAAKVDGWCTSIANNYNTKPTADQLETVRQALNQLADALAGPTTTADSYLDKVACSEAIYESIQQDPLAVAQLYGQDRVWSFHYFFKHTTQEIPLAFWHKCVLMSGQKLTQSTGGLAMPTVKCDAWNDPVKTADIERTDYTTSPLKTLLRTDGVISRAQSATVRQILGQLVSATVNLYVDHLDEWENRFGHKGMKKGAAMACHSSAAFRSKEGTPTLCWSRLVRWAQRGGLPGHLPTGNMYDKDGGVPPSCYEFQGPYVGTSRELDAEYGTYLATVNNAGYNPKPFQEILKLLTPERVAQHHVRPVDFVTQDIQKSLSGTGHGLVMWEFDPPEFGPVSMPLGGEVSDVVDGCKKTNLDVFRKSMADRIPCVTPGEVKDDFKCSTKIKQPTVMTPASCTTRYTDIRAQIEQRARKAREDEVLINGELRKGTYQASDKLSDADIAGLVLGSLAIVFVPGPGTVAGAATIGAIASKQNSPKPVLRTEQNENVVLWPKDLEDMLYSALQNSTDYCKMQVKAEATTYCQTDQQLQAQTRGVTGLGMQYSTFKAGLMINEFDIQSGLDHTTIQQVTDSASFAFSGISISNFNDILASSDVSSFDYKTEESSNLAQALAGGTEEANALLSRRRSILEDTFKQTDALVAAVTQIDWYDCTSQLNVHMCISDDATLLNVPNFHTNLRGQTPAEIQRVNGNHDINMEQGCLWLGVPTGRFNCRWHMHDGIQEEVDRVRRLSWLQTLPNEDAYGEQLRLGNIPECKQGHRFKHPISGVDLAWGLSCSRVLKGAQVQQKQYCAGGPTYNVTSDTDAVMYTAYVRMIGELMNPERDGQATSKRSYKYSDALSLLAPRVFPLPSRVLELPSNGNFDPAGSLKELNLGTQQALDNVVDQFQDCSNGVATASYSTCSDDLLRVYDAAKLDVDRYLRRKGPVLVQPNTALVWDGLHASHFLSPSIPAWASAKRAGKDVFVEWLYDKTKRCQAGSYWNAVCLRNSLPLRSVNPWLGGKWNPYEGCDTDFSGGALDEAFQDEVFDVNCYEQVCPDRRTDGVPFYDNMPKPGGTPCWYKSSGHTVVDLRGVPRASATNLCFQRPAESTVCSHRQGMLGGLNGSAVLDLYQDDLPLVLSVASHQLARDGLGLFYQGGNPLYYTAKGSKTDVEGQVHAALNLHQDDLGGHHLVLVVGEDGVMRVDRVPLARTSVQPQAAGGYAPSEIAVINSRKSNVTHGLSGWMVRAEFVMNQETVLINKLYPVINGGVLGTTSAGRVSWSCPLQRVAFWNRLENAAVFDPIVPNPMRTEKLFAQEPRSMTKGTRAHPTMQSRTLDDLSKLYTSNGFCFCQSPDACMIPKADWTGGGDKAQCGLLSTIESVVGGAEKQAVNLDGQSCARQLDWPFLHGTLRDGMDAGDRHIGTLGDPCNVLDRLPSFKYAYKKVGVAAQPAGLGAMDEGGSCHMGRAASRPVLPTGVTVQSCTAVQRNSTHVRAKCRSGDTWAEIVMERKKSVAPTEMVRTLQRRRRRCHGAASQGGQTCTPPPKYYAEDGLNELPAGAETSYGIPFRWSAARVIAADVKSKLCGHDNHTSQCDGMLNVPEWSMSKFLGNLFDTPDKLFKFQVWEDGQDVLAEAVERRGRPDESQLWNGSMSQWVLCDQLTGECKGSIPESDWLAAAPVRRMAMCTDAIRLAEAERRADGREPTAVHLNICDLNSQMDDLCRRLQEARQKVIDINCQMTGACSVTEHVYTPGLYSSTNQDFVSGTIATYYEIFNPHLPNTTFDPSTAEDRVCPLTGLDRDLLVQNAEFKKGCASHQVESLSRLIRVARLFTNLIARTMYAFLNIFMSLLRLLMEVGNSNQRAGAMQEIQFWAKQLANDWANAITEIANLLFETVFGSGLGQALKQAIQSVCDKINEMLVFVNAVKAWLSQALAGLLDKINDIISSVPGIARNQEITNAASTLRSWGAAQLQPLACNLESMPDVSDIAGAVSPVPTMCWAQYVASIDDSNALSCSRSDTCRREGLLFGEAAAAVDDPNQPVLCGTCAASLVSGSVVQYGCDTATKECTCGVRATQRTSCTANYQCWINDEAWCNLAHDVSSVNPSGGLPCKQCGFSQPVCLVTDGASGAGTCACLLLGSQPAQCAAADAPLDTASPNDETLCAVSLDPQAAQRSSGTLEWANLATAPCALANQGQTFCYKVDGQGLLAVGLGVVDTGLLGRRRLLQSSDADEREWEQLMERIERFGGWNETATPCRELAARALVLASWNELGVLDRVSLQSCVRWRETAADLIRRNDMEALVGHDYLLLSPADFARAVMHKGTLTALAATPAFWAGAALAHPWAAPARALAGRVALYLHSLAVDMRDELQARAQALNGSAPTGFRPIANTTLWKLADTLGMLAGANASAHAGERAADARWVLQQVRSFATAQKQVLRELGGMGLHRVQEIADSLQGARKGKKRAAQPARPVPTMQKPSSQPAAPRPGRRLLASTDPSIAVAQYTSLVAALGTAGGVVPIGGPLADIWVQGPIGWPPRFEYWSQEAKDSCMATAVFWDLATDALATVIRSYQIGFSQDRFRRKPTRLAEQVPVFYAGNETALPGASAWRAPGGSGASAASLYEWFGDNVLYNLLGMTPASIAAFFGLGDKRHPNELTLGLLVRDLVVCDFEATTLCTKRNRGLWDSMVLTALLYTLVSALVSAMGGGGASLMLWASSPWAVLYLAYGYAPTCTPQVPVCLGADVVDLLRNTLPLPIRWPDSMQRFAGCLDRLPDQRFPNVNAGTADCLRSCADDPFLFDGRWETPMAWAVCGLVRNCSQVVLPFVGTPPALQQSLRSMQAVLESQDTDMAAGYTYCFIFTLAKTLPWIFLLLAALCVAVALLKIPFVLVTALVQFLVQGLCYTHAS